MSHRRNACNTSEYLQLWERGGSLDNSFRLLAILVAFRSDALAFFVVKMPFTLPLHLIEISPRLLTVES